MSSQKRMLGRNRNKNYPRRCNVMTREGLRPNYLLYRSQAIKLDVSDLHLNGKAQNGSWSPGTLVRICFVSNGVSEAYRFLKNDLDASAELDTELQV